MNSVPKTITPDSPPVNARIQLRARRLNEREGQGKRPAFEQAALAALERCALFLIPHLPCETWEELVVSLHCVRRALGLPPPHHPMLDLRDWPQDRTAADALGTLLARLDELESLKRVGR